MSRNRYYHLVQKGITQHVTNQLAYIRHQGDRTNPVSAMDFPRDDDKKRQQRAAAQSYQEELNRQVSFTRCLPPYHLV